jgi:hypothetical protein
MYEPALDLRNFLLQNERSAGSGPRFAIGLQILRSGDPAHRSVRDAGRR